MSLSYIFDKQKIMLDIEATLGEYLWLLIYDKITIILIGYNMHFPLK